MMMKNIKYLIFGLLILAVGTGGFFFTKSNLLKETPSSVKGAVDAPTQEPTSQPTPNFEKTIGEFLVTNREILKENGKPAVYFFGSSSCPHCVWEKPIAQEVFDQFKNEISYHENFDDANKDADVFTKYSDINPGYVPFLILGGKYVRVGAGENLGKTPEESKKLEKEALTAILCKLTEGKPAGVCAAVKDKTSQVK